VRFCVLDTETFWAKDYTLSKLTTESYIMDDRFEVICIAIKIGDAPTQVFSGDFEETKNFLNQFDWSQLAVAAHNFIFDGSILGLRFGIHPAKCIDTLSMSRALFGIEVGGSLAKLAEHYQLGTKGTDTVQSCGLSRLDFTSEHLQSYMAYCVSDVELTYKLFYKLLPHFTKSELDIIDITLKMATRPLLELDKDVLTAHLADVQAKKQALMDKVIVSKKDLMSNVKLAQLLIDCGVEPPMKLSPTTGKPAYAFAKTDEGFRALLDSDNLMVQTIISARLGVKSTLEETRTQTFLGIAERNKTTPVPLAYYGCATGRWAAAGGQKINFQNITRGSELRKAFRAPAGHVIVGADLSNIELRVALWLAGEWGKLQDIKDGLDLYKVFAAKAYEVPYEEVNKLQRFVGKTCVAEGTKVLCQSGWKSIELISLDDKLWDGDTWACHHGLVTNSLKETLSICGAWLTPEHLVWSGTQWIPASQVVSTESILSQVLATGSERLPSQGMCWGKEAGSKPSSFVAIADAPNICSASTVIKFLRLLDALNVRAQQALENGIGCISKACRMIPIEPAYLTDSVQLLLDVTTPHTNDIEIMGGGGLQCIRSGGRIKEHSFNIYKPWKGGIIQSSRWIESTTIKDTCRAIFDLFQKVTTPKISVVLGRCKQKLNGSPLNSDNNGTPSMRKCPVYDIASVGTKNRFTILTNSGPIIVHNCVLGLQYQVGGAKLQATVRAGSGLDMGIVESKRIVELYREEYAGIKAAWAACGRAIIDMANDRYSTLGTDGILLVEGAKGIRYPSGLYMKYPQLQLSEDGQTRSREYKYKIRNGWDKLYPGKCFNACIAEGTLVLTDSGWKPIEGILNTDLVHDGDNYVSHDGKLFKSVQRCVIVDGVYMTPDHEVLTDEGWQIALDKPRPYRPNIRGVDSNKDRPQRWKEYALALCLRVWARGGEGRSGCNQRSEAWGIPKLWVFNKNTNEQEAYSTWDVCRGAYISRLGGIKNTLHKSIRTCMEKLRRAGDISMSGMDGVFREFSKRHGALIQAGIVNRPHRQQSGILCAELSMGDSYRTSDEQTRHYQGSECPTIIQSDRDRQDNTILSSKCGSDGTSIDMQTGPRKHVYDILNAGPQQRFVIKGNEGPFIVHNCVQGTARCVMAEAMPRINKRYPICHSIHDALYIIAPEAEAQAAQDFLITEMCRPPAWMPDCPLNAEGHYGKTLYDC